MSKHSASLAPCPCRRKVHRPPAAAPPSCVQHQLSHSWSLIGIFVVALQIRQSTFSVKLLRLYLGPAHFCHEFFSCLKYFCISSTYKVESCYISRLAKIDKILHARKDSKCFKFKMAVFNFSTVDTFSESGPKCINVVLWQLSSQSHFSDCSLADRGGVHLIGSHHQSLGPIPATLGPNGYQS